MIGIRKHFCINDLVATTVIMFIIDTFFTLTKNLSVAAIAKSGLLNGMSFKMPSYYLSDISYSKRSFYQYTEYSN